MRATWLRFGLNLGVVVGLAAVPASDVAQMGTSTAHATAMEQDPPSARVVVKSEAGPTFQVSEKELSKPVTVIAYGDTRFHEGNDPKVVDSVARRALVAKIAAEKPDAVMVSGDVPYQGGNAKDYDVYREETAAWRAERLRVYPAIGNHEMYGDGDPLGNWWATFPELMARRWYSVALGKRIYMIQLDSTSDLTAGSRQRLWLEAQLKGMGKSVDFVMIGLHHPPVADVQTRIEVDHNPRPNEIELKDYLTREAPKIHARMVVIAGHIHNYERAQAGGVVYLVSGGGGAHPYEVDRTAEDQYKDKGFPNFHYVKFELRGREMRATMYRLKDGAAGGFEAKDGFVLREK